MIARRSVWSDPEVQGLLKRFVVCADEVSRLQRGKDPECALAQKVFEQGHYAGRTQPTNTRQGIYATAPSGVMLASINSNDPQRVARMLQSALDKWGALSEAERVLRQNWREGAAEGRPYAYTEPSPGRYPWQWYWDSCFAAIVNRRWIVYSNVVLSQTLRLPARG